MQEAETLLVFAITSILFIFRFVNQDKRIHKKVDGVESIDGIKYLIKDTDVNYVMYKLNSTCISRNIKEKKFDVVNDSEGILTFGGVIMKISFEKREHKWFSPSTEQPGFVLNQAYHRFFKEIFDVQVVK